MMTTRPVIRKKQGLTAGTVQSLNNLSTRTMGRCLKVWVAATVATLAHGLAPPHPDFVEWESVHEMRRRLNITYSYQPRHLHAEFCRYLTEEQCRAQDLGINTNEASRKGLPRPKRRRLNPSTGDVKILVLLLKFKDQVNVPVPSRANISEMFNGEGATEINPVGSIKEWMRYNSLGQYRPVFDVRDWQVTEQDEAYYGDGISGLGDGSRIQEMWAPILTKMDEKGEVDWLDGYVTVDGYLNHFLVVHSGYAAEMGDFPCLVNTYANRIWSHGRPHGTNGWHSRDWFEIDGYAIASVFQGPVCENLADALPVGFGRLQQADEEVGGEEGDRRLVTGKALYRATAMGTITHEFMHGMGLPDVYDLDTTQPKIKLGGLGRFDIMSASVGWNQDATRPGHMSPWSKMQLNWLVPITLTNDGFYPVQPSEVSSTVYKISAGFPTGEYLLIENRQPIKWDSNWPAGGIVIYHVDENMTDQSRRGYPGLAGWPTRHYMISVLQADGQYGIEKGTDVGDVGDIWAINQTLGPGGSGSNVVWPNTDAYQGGLRKETGISITIMSESAFIMIIQVSGLPSGSGNGTSGSARDGTVQGQQRNTTIPRAGITSTSDQPQNIGARLAWMLGTLSGVGLMVGLLAFVLV